MLLFVGLFGSATCDDDDGPYWGGGDPDPLCRSNPADCPGDIGGFCDFDEDCDDGACCRDNNCGGGMCTYFCRGNVDCPYNMLCEHGYCFFTCAHDNDCGPGQQCEHGETICEYEGGH